MLNEKFMKLALKQAQAAYSHDEVPIGAVVVKDDKVIARAYNTRNRGKNAVAHAEVLAISRACAKLGDWRLNGCTLYVTLEPCVMCLGACYNARISKVVFGAYDVNGKGCFRLAEEIGNTLNHNLEIVGGVMEDDCSQLLTQYFENKRNKGKL